MRFWLASIGTDTLFIEPGSPSLNAYIESFNGRLRDELRNGEISLGLAEAKFLIERWRTDYNQVRPHSSLGYVLPLWIRRELCAFRLGFASPPGAQLVGSQRFCETQVPSTSSPGTLPTHIEAGLAFGVIPGPRISSVRPGSQGTQSSEMLAGA